MSDSFSRVSTLRAIVLTFLFVCVTTPLTLAQPQSQPHFQPQSQDGYYWVTGWAMSPSTLPPAADAEDAFNNQTLRQIVRVSANGEQIRLRLANTHGNKPLRVGALTVARQTDSAGIDVTTLQNVTVSGQGSFTIPRGAVVMSDPLDMTVVLFDQLSISLYLPQGSGHATLHRAAAQTGYVAAGDQTRAAQLPAGTAETGFWHFIHGVDVASTTPMTTIVTLGDSITDGVGSTANTNRRWPDYFAERLRDAAGMPAYAVANAGLSGNRVLHERSLNFGENLLARFERDVLALSNVSHIVLLEGINDIGMAVSMATDQEVTPEQIIAGYRQVITRARARGIKVIGATLTPFEGAGYYTEAGEVKRQTVNTWIRSAGAFDAVIDFDAAIRDSANPGRLPASFTSDNLHPNDAGYRTMADAIELEIFTP